MKLFSELGLDNRLFQATEALGFVNPTPIQEQVIPILLEGTKDLIGLAQTGTGKTAAFGLPLLQLVSEKDRFPQALIVCPTRELCMQIVKEVMLFKKFMPTIHIVAVYGGASIGLQIKDLRNGVQIIVATPGRLIDLIERKAIKLEAIKYVVLDEADEMLNMGFKDDIEFILENTPNRASTWLFSATMPSEIKKVSNRYMNHPVEITVGQMNTANENIDHQYFIVSAQHRYEALKRLIDFTPGIYGIIFTRTKMDAQNISEKLTREGYDIDALHGDLTQQQRDRVMGAFRSRALQLLIATDVAARGIDVKDITHVINFELPDDVEVYTHRSGRTGRAGNTGICMSIVHSRELHKLKQIERIVKARLNKLEIPSGKDVCRKQFFHFMDKLLSADISNENYDSYLPMLQEKFADVSKDDVLKRVATLEFDRFLKYYENAEDLNFRVSDRRGERREFGSSNARERNSTPYRRDDNRRSGGTREYSSSASGGNFKKLFINLGSKDGFYKASFLQFILDMSALRKDSVGRIDVRDMNSFIEVDNQSASKMIAAIDGKSYRGRKIRINEA